MSYGGGLCSNNDSVCALVCMQDPLVFLCMKRITLPFVPGVFFLVHSVCMRCIHVVGVYIWVRQVCTGVVGAGVAHLGDHEMSGPAPGRATHHSYDQHTHTQKKTRLVNTVLGGLPLLARECRVVITPGSWWGGVGVGGSC